MRAAAGVLAVLVLLTGCGEERTMTTSIDEAAGRFRAEVDALAERLGGTPQVRQDEVGSCDPSDADSGRNLAYFVAIDADAGTLEQVRGPVADQMRADGWRVTDGPGETAGFAKDGMNVSVLVDPAAGRATVGGSSACVQDG